MELVELIIKLEKNRAVFKSLFNNIQQDQIHWKPNENKWSMLEIVCHLLDEEKEDFRQRIDFTLHRPGDSWPAIDPQGWEKSRNYAGTDFKESIANFLAEREESVKWLKALKDANWENSYKHPAAGLLSAKQLLANWLAHDFLHIRQIIGMNFIYLQERVSPLKLDYAGDW